MNRKAWKHIASIMLATASLSLAGETATTLNYQGRIGVSGSDINGDGYFKFRLINHMGEGVWGSDGSPGTNEPGNYVTLSLGNGLFNVDLGDTFSGMASLPATGLQHWEVWLRTWFSTNNAGPFEQLTPDIRIRKLSFADIDTGNSVIVDGSGRGDFTDIQSAIDFVATNEYYWHTIQIWPGYYAISSPLVLPTNRWLRLQGLGNAGDGVSVWNTNGAALKAGNGMVENLQLSGAPAVYDEGASDYYNFSLKDCLLQSCANGQPALRQHQGQILLAQCTVSGHEEGGFGIVAGTNAQLSVVHCQISSGGTDPAIRIAGGASVEFESCRTFVGNSASSALLLDNTTGYGDFRMCQFNGGAAISNCQGTATFADCQFNGGNSGRNCVRIDEGSAQTTLRGCALDGNSNTAFLVRNATGFMVIEDSRINVSDESALAINATSEALAGQTVSVIVRNSRLHANSSTGTTDKDAVTLVAANGVETELTLASTSVDGGMRDGIAISGADCSVEIAQSPGISGRRHAIAAPNGGEVNVVASDVWSETDDGINMSGNGMLWIRASEVSTGDSGAGSAISAALAGVCLIAQSTLGSDRGPALELDSGLCLCTSSFLRSGTNTIAFLKTTNTVAEFSHCKFFSTADLFGTPSPAPAITLYGATGNTPVPRILSCIIEPSRSASYSIAVTGSSTTGMVMMAQSGLTVGLASNIVNLLLTSDSAGNYLIPSGP